MNNPHPHISNIQDPDPQFPNPNDDPNPNHPLQLQSHPQPRRPRGFAATSGAAAAATGTINKSRKEREKEKERTKLRERHRRAITSRMLAGLRQYGNFPLPVRADMNDVLAALARHAGWTVEPDGTTFRQSPPPPPPPPPTTNNASNMGPYQVMSVESPVSGSSLRNCSTRTSVDCQPSVPRINESLSPASFDSIVVTESDTKVDKFTSTSPLNSSECLEAGQLMQELHCGEHGSSFSETQYVPVFVMLSSGVINNFCQLMDPDGVKQELQQLKSLKIDGVVVNCWWGIVESWVPQKYEWSGYRELFNIIRDFNMKLQVVMAFHENGGSDTGGMFISLPQWVLEIGKDNQDIFFTDRQGRRNTECLSWGIDKERVLRGRIAIEVYYDLMRSFRTEFDDLFTDGLISAVEIGLGASGELKYPSFSERMGWRYPGIAEGLSETAALPFKFYDKYSLQNLRKAASSRGHSFWAKGPDNAGYYNSKPHETGFFCERGDYDSYYGRFFLHWYRQVLIDHADNILSLATLAFEGIQIVVKIPAIYWWYRTSSHAAELTAGYYNPTNQDGYSSVFEVLRKHSVTIKFVSSGLQVPETDDALADPEGLSWQILNSAWDKEINVAGQNAFPCYDREGLMRLVETAKPRNDPDRHCFSFFAFQPPSPLVQSAICFSELEYFIKCMHGEINNVESS
ncbi:beta-amylase 8 isoform X4 [Solanum dulcamara]|uniref:beta-amylase 8 isoform X4 n=1 Tax=Solanum dulcamara TaxID=45834 RepID=UPI0024858F3D|nr:beta-amylase 8 isoform X4 [Solanum dulcamara]